MRGWIPHLCIWLKKKKERAQSLQIQWKGGCEGSTCLDFLCPAWNGGILLPRGEEASTGVGCVWCRRSNMGKSTHPHLFILFFENSPTSLNSGSFFPSRHKGWRFGAWQRGWRPELYNEDVDLRLSLATSCSELVGYKSLLVKMAIGFDYSMKNVFFTCTLSSI